MLRITIISAILLIIIASSGICQPPPPYGVAPDWTSFDARFTTDISVADFNNDGYPDVVASNYRYPHEFTPETIEEWDEADIGDYIGIYWNQGPNNYLNDDPSLIGEGNSEFRRCWECLAVGDYNHDNFPDLAVGSVVGAGNDGFNYVFRNIGNDSYFNIDSVIHFAQEKLD